MSGLCESPNTDHASARLIRPTIEQVVVHTLSQRNPSYFKGTHTCARPFLLSQDPAWSWSCARSWSRARAGALRRTRHTSGAASRMRLPYIQCVLAHSCIMYRFALRVKYRTSGNFRALQWRRHPLTSQRFGLRWNTENWKRRATLLLRNETWLYGNAIHCRINSTLVRRVARQREKNGDRKIWHSRNKDENLFGILNSFFSCFSDFTQVRHYKHNANGRYYRTCIIRNNLKKQRHYQTANFPLLITAKKFGRDINTI